MLEEFDLDTAIQRRPDLLLVDELAHTNAPGSRHLKRYQDVLELLDAGIDVCTTLNVQHIETALISDDEIQIRRLLRLALESRGYTVKEAGNGQLGLQEAAFHRPDVILLDLGLSDMDGSVVLQRLREWSDAAVLILSVRDQEDVKVAA